LLTRLNFWDGLSWLVKLREGLSLCRYKHKLRRLNISESCGPEAYRKLVVREVVKSCDQFGYNLKLVVHALVSRDGSKKLIFGRTIRKPNVQRQCVHP